MTLFEDTIQARPFIKWVGGKTQLLDEVAKFLPKDFATRQHLTYVEPFVGGGAVMFWILQAYPNIEHAVINDINEELICTYQVIKEDVESLIFELTHIQQEYIPLKSDDRKTYFLAKRNRFNTKQTTSVETAAKKKKTFSKSRFKETISENWQSTPLKCHHLRYYCYLRKPNGKVGGIHMQSLATAVGR